jgi:hypothetical protein
MPVALFVLPHINEHTIYIDPGALSACYRQRRHDFALPWINYSPFTGKEVHLI